MNIANQNKKVLPPIDPSELGQNIMRACLTLLGLMVGTLGIFIGEYKLLTNAPRLAAESRYFVLIMCFFIVFNGGVCIIAFLSSINAIRNVKLIVVSFLLMIVFLCIILPVWGIYAIS